MKLSQIVMTLVSEDSTTDARDVIQKASSTQLHQQVMYVINLWGKQLDKNFLIYMLNKVLTIRHFNIERTEIMQICKLYK